ncbi:hypothetical protein [Enterococcus sp. C76]|uniref:hypothetical protein n=1 Tax=Enterococcus TaxID=1350 RepID=UPI0034A08C96
MGGMDDNTNQLMWIIYILLIGAAIFAIFKPGMTDIGNSILNYVKSLIPAIQ